MNGQWNLYELMSSIKGNDKAKRSCWCLYSHLSLRTLTSVVEWERKAVIQRRIGLMFNHFSIIQWETHGWQQSPSNRDKLVLIDYLTTSKNSVLMFDRQEKDHSIRQVLFLNSNLWNRRRWKVSMTLIGAEEQKEGSFVSRWWWWFNISVISTDPYPRIDSLTKWKDQESFKKFEGKKCED